MKTALTILGFLSCIFISAQNSYLYLVGLERKEIMRIDSSGQAEVLLKGYSKEAAHIYFDHLDKKIYWGITKKEGECTAGQLYRANMDGSGVESILSSSLFVDEYGLGLPIIVDSRNDRAFLLAGGDLIQVNLATLAVSKIEASGGSKGDFYLNQEKQQIYYTTYSGIYSYDIELESSQFLFPLLYPGPLAVDTIDNYIYCSSLIPGQGFSIYKTDAEGQTVDTIKTDIGMVGTILIDQQREHLYWTEDNSIYRSDLNGNNETLILEDPETSKLKLAFDSEKQEVYWGWPSIQKSRTDVIIPEVILEQSDHFIRGMVVDASKQLIYWSEASSEIFYADYNLDSTHALSFDQVIAPSEITLDENTGNIYWADDQDNQIHRANLTNGQVEVWSNEEEQLFGFYLTHLQIDGQTEEIFWFDKLESSIKKSSLDLYEPLSLYTSPYLERGFAVDKTNQRIYWIEYQANLVILKSMNYDGSQVEVIPQNSPLSGSFRRVFVSGDQIILTKPHASPTIYISDDKGLNFYPWSFSCLPVELQIVGNFSTPNIVPVKNTSAMASFRVSPNPANQYLQLNFDGKSLPREKLQASLFSPSGIRIKTQKLGQLNERIDISSLPAGLYYLTLTSETGQVYLSEKIIVSGNR